jgi:putative heme-binding domain-containing protein
MTRPVCFTFALFCAGLSGGCALSGAATTLELQKGERLALVGNALGERMNLFGHFETFLHSRFPDRELVVRNFCRPADEVGLRQRPNDYTRLDDPLAVFGPDTFLCFFGFNESFAGPAGIEQFQRDYERFIADYGRKYARDGRGRFVLVSPIAFEQTGNPFQPDGRRENANLRLYTAAIAAVAQRLNAPLADLFTPTARLFGEKPGAQFTVNGCHLNEAGDRVVAGLLERALFGAPSPARSDAAAFEKLRAAVNDKAWVHFHDYRMLNGWYVYGSRRTNDAETFPREIQKIRRLAAVRDRYVWDLAQGKPVSVAPDDSQTGELVAPRTRFGTQAYSEPKELRYFKSAEAMTMFTVAKGYEINLVASEEQWPELAKPAQLNFDGKNRLWVATMPAYPQWRPGDPRPDDKLLILEDADADGRADRLKVFARGLHLPTGFEFFNGGVLVVSQPRLLFLKDTDGDDVADVRVELFDGFATDDTHQAIGAFEWSPGGLLRLLEGVSMSTAVETPWGPFRNHNTSVCYELDAAALRLGVHVTPCFVNPWCYTHDRWGQGFVGDGTGGQQYWATPLSGAPFPGRRGSRVFINPGFRPAFGCEIISSRHFPDEAQGDYLIANVVGFNGIGRFRVREEGSGYSAEKIEPLVESGDKNFRPGDPQIGPDGALYFVDWHNALVGHLQYPQRDPNRDRAHGRVYRVTAAGRPLLRPPPVEGAPLASVLDQLKAPEARASYRARRELRARDPQQVLPALRRWVAALDPTDPDYERHLCEALWVQQGHHAVELPLLRQLLAARDFHARAAAVHVLADERERLPDPLALLRPRLTDEHPRVRVEAVRALSFFASLASAELALAALAAPRDYYLDYTLQSTLGALEPVWRGPFNNGQFPRDNSGAREFLKNFRDTTSPDANVQRQWKLLLAGDASAADRARAIRELAGAQGDATAGQAVFARACIACHKVGAAGADFAPDLTHVAARLPRAEIIESIIDPNAKVDPKYVATNVTTRDGDEFSGLVAAEDDRRLTLVLGSGQQQVIHKSQIARRDALRLSSMPDGLAQTMSAQEFLDLIEYLAAQR